MSIPGITAQDDEPSPETVLQNWHEMHELWHTVLDLALATGDSQLEARAESGIERCEAAFERCRRRGTPQIMH